MLFDHAPEAAPPTCRPGALPSPSEVSVSVGFVGDMSGQVVLGMSRAVALEMAGTLLMAPLADFDEIAQSGMAEVGNMVAGACATALAEQGPAINITVPTLISGDAVQGRIPQLTIFETTFQLPFGPLRFAVGVRP